MNAETNKKMILEFMERAFNQGDTLAVEEYLADDAVDHQEPEGVKFTTHLKAVIVGLRSAFPDLNFEIHDVLAEGDIVAFRSTMTGTHMGPFRMAASPVILPTGNRISVQHMHFVRVVEGKGTDLWHLWDTASLREQLRPQVGTAYAA